MFDQKIALFHQHAATKEEALELLSKEFVKAGVVEENFLEGLLKREANFPTGLLTDVEGFGVAIPHTDSEYVRRNQLGFMSLDEPVTFQYMADPETEVPVKLMVMMAIQGHDQVDMLMKLMGMFSDPELLDELTKVNDFESFEAIAKKAGLIEE